MNMNNQIRGPIQIPTPGPLASAPGPVQMAATGALAGLLPDLLPVPAPAFPVVLSPGFCDFNPTTRVLTVRVLNQGILATPGPFVVAVVFSGCALGTGGAPIEHAISAFAPALGPGQTATLLFPVPAQCPTNQFTIMVDPSGSVPESNKMNNVMVVQCGVVPR